MGESMATGQPHEPDEAEVTEPSAEPAEEAPRAGQSPAASPGPTPDIKWQGGPRK